jgi:homoserine kinase
MKIKVPATSANLGCGFDSVGFAVNLYLELEVLGPSDKWEVVHELGVGGSGAGDFQDIPRDETNLIVAAALKIAPKLTPHKIRLASDIPIARGLGSSSSALVAGIELACVLGGVNLSTQEKLRLACDMEGHPDNVVPAILGGLVISSYSSGGSEGGSLEYVKADMPDVGLVVYVPGYRLSTTDMRKVLPKELTHKDAVYASSVSNVMIAALVSGDMEKAGRLMEQDRFHERYRAKLIPELKEVRGIARSNGAYATYLSGAGSAIMCIVPKEKTDEVVWVLSKKGIEAGAHRACAGLDSVRPLQIDVNGIAGPT